MQITIELPEDIALGLESKWKDLPRAALESLALEAYRFHALTAAQLRRSVPRGRGAATFISDYLAVAAELSSVLNQTAKSLSPTAFSGGSP